MCEDLILRSHPLAYWSDKGEEASISAAVNAVDLCAREPQGRAKCSKIADYDDGVALKWCWWMGVTSKLNKSERVTVLGDALCVVTPRRPRPRTSDAVEPIAPSSSFERERTRPRVAAARRGASARSRLRSKGRRRVQAESGPRKEDERRCVFITASDAMVRCRTRGAGGRALRERFAEEAVQVVERKVVRVEHVIQRVVVFAQRCAVRHARVRSLVRVRLSSGRGERAGVRGSERR